MARSWYPLLVVIVSIAVKNFRAEAVTEEPKGKLSDSIRKGLTENATFLKKHQLARSLLAADESFEDAPFWANRGRRSAEGNWQNRNIHLKGENPNELENDRLRRMESSLEDLPFWANRGKRLKNSGEEFPFWANRGKRVKSSDEEFPFWANRGKRLKSSAEELPFWANRGKRNLGGSDEELPFWANRGKRSASERIDSVGKRTLSEEYPFWANRGRRNHLSDETIEDEPFWANRGRRKRQEGGNIFHPKKLYVDEPGWIVLDRREPSNRQGNKNFWAYFGRARNEDRKGVTSEEDIPFWAVRGKKNNQESGYKQISPEEDAQLLRPIPWQLARLDSTRPAYMNQKMDQP